MLYQAVKFQKNVFKTCGRALIYSDIVEFCWFYMSFNNLFEKSLLSINRPSSQCSVCGNRDHHGVFSSLSLEVETWGRGPNMRKIPEEPLKRKKKAKIQYDSEIQKLAKSRTLINQGLKLQTTETRAGFIWGDVTELFTVL